MEEVCGVSGSGEDGSSAERRSAGEVVIWACVETDEGVGRWGISYFLKLFSRRIVDLGID